ncbi:hypothetical protein [Streptomyces sp. GESEQ-4]|uniref:hypothetical protein n=1 Tax=Streptomyces sp. GESEQ-4 TaxID=2812655 RepID=UPI001B332476|nr:hypothetical protein [Streptomyces sp. GESEQ-4]
MNKSLLRKASGAAATVVAVGALSLWGTGAAAAAPSNPAGAGECLYILNTSNYPTTPDRLKYCNIGEGGGIDWLTCYAGLYGTGVNQTVAALACNAASD